MGNVSEHGGDDDLNKFLEENPIYRPPRKGETGILNMPQDCLGVIVEYLDDFSSIRALMISCRDFYMYFKNQQAMERVSFSLNFAIELKKKIDFIYRLRCQTFFYRKVRNHHFRYFPNLKYLYIEYTEQIDSEIFPLLPNLVELVVRGGHFGFMVSESRGLHKLSDNIKTISIRNKSSGRYGSQHNYSTKSECHLKESFFKDVLLQRPGLLELEFWRFKFLKFEYDFFHELSQSLKSLRKLSLRNCQVIEYQHLNFPSSLEELDLCGCYFPKESDSSEGKKEEEEEERIRKKNMTLNLPIGLKKLNLSDQHVSCKIEGIFDGLKEGEYTNMTHLEISENMGEIDSVVLRIAKIFPNLEYLRAVDTGIGGEGMKALIGMKKLKTVRLSKNSLNRQEELSRELVIQKRGNVTFVVL